MSTRKRKAEKGIEVRDNADGSQSFRGHVWSARDSKRIRGPWVPTISAARNWRVDAQAAIRKGEMRAPVPTTLREAADEFIAGARDGRILNRKGAPYRPSVLRDYEGDLRRHVLPTLGDRRLGDIRRADVQDLVESLVAAGLAPSTVRNALDPLRRIFDRAVKRDTIPFSPCQHLEVPRGTGRREGIDSPATANALIAALPESEQALWSVLFYAGLRMGEARALRWSDVDLQRRVIHVRRTWDDVEGEQDGGKTAAARRTVTMLDEVRVPLMAHRLATGRRDDDLVFGRTADQAEDRGTIRRRARKAWKAAGLEPVTPHQCRHVFASILAASGIDADERQRQMGHVSDAMMRHYSHGFEDSVADTGRRVQAWLEDQRRKAAG